jgi:hydrogenase maturation protease
VPPDVVILERAGDVLALIDDWAGHDAVILVDASARGIAPGTVRRIDLLEEALPPEFSLSSTHGFGVAEAVGLAGTLGLLPARVIAYAIEAGDFARGAAVSPEVAAAAHEVVARVAAELRDLLRGDEVRAPRHGDEVRAPRHSGEVRDPDRGDEVRDPRHGPARPGHHPVHNVRRGGPVDPPTRSGEDHDVSGDGDAVSLKDRLR